MTFKRFVVMFFDFFGGFDDRFLWPMDVPG